jgi:hypothetical protein
MLKMMYSKPQTAASPSRYDINSHPARCLRTSSKVAIREIKSPQTDVRNKPICNGTENGLSVG